MELDSFDYKEPHCATCGGKEFYHFDKDAPLGRIPVDRIIRKLDGLFEKDDMAEAGRLLEYWLGEAMALKDKEGELSIRSELVGYYRKMGEKDKGLYSCERAIELIGILGFEDSVSAATIWLNCATTYKAFGKAEKALPLYDKTMQVYQKHLSSDDSRFGGYYNNKGLTLEDLNMFDDAESCYKKAIEIMSHVKNGEADMAISYVNMAHLYEKMGRNDDIDICLDKAYELLDAPTLEKNGYYAYVCSKCAPSYDYFGYFLQKEELFRRAKEIYERT